MSESRDGYVKLWRKLRRSWMWQRPLCPAMAWMDMVMRASYCDRTVSINGHPIRLERGELCVGIRTLATDWGWTKAKAERFLDGCEREAQIRRAKTGTQRGRIPGRIAICNYDTYNPIRDTSETQTGTQRGHNADTTRTEEGIKGIEEGKEGRGASPSDLVETEMAWRMFAARYKDHPPVTRKQFGDRIGTVLATGVSMTKAKSWIRTHPLDANLKPWGMFDEISTPQRRSQQDRPVSPVLRDTRTAEQRAAAKAAASAALRGAQ